VKSIPSPSATFGESLSPTDQKYKRNKKRKNKKKKQTQREKSPTNTTHVGDKKPTTTSHFGDVKQDIKSHAQGKKLANAIHVGVINIDEKFR
jgi:hypothetical protein